MERTSFVLVVLLAVTSASADNLPPQVTAYAAYSRSASLAPTTKSRLSTPNSPTCADARVRPTLAVTDSPPPFGTVVQEWELQMGGSWAGAGITWRRDSGRFYLMDQGYGGQSGVWSCDPFDPPGTERQENWVIPNFGAGTVDIPWSIAWDSDSNCFWISNILDGSVYNGCYYVRMRQTPVGDTWRWFSENPGDTWLVGDGSCGGAGNMYWMAGSEKWLGRDYFACMPVASSSPNNNVWKFDPYTKTGLGRCQYGERYSERGLTLVPWDSTYILTAGWTDPYLIKRDTTGFPLDSAFGQEISDIALWVPDVIRPDDTVFMYSILNLGTNYLQKRSTGLLWGQLPSVNPSNVQPLSILAPTGTVDSGQTVTPRLVVRNTGTTPADSVNTCFTIDVNGTPMYADSITGLSLAAGVSETLAFTNWNPDIRDSMSVIAWTSWSGDSFPKDDTIRSRFFVRVKDIAIPWFGADRDTYELGDTVTIHGRVENRGNVSLNFDLGMWYDESLRTRNLNLIAGGVVTIGWGPGVPEIGMHIAGASAIVVGDLSPENNTFTDTFWVTETGVEEERNKLGAFGLSPITNPCRNSVTISFHSPLPTPYSLALYDATGRLVHSSLGLRASSFRLDLRSMPVGVYVLRLNAGTFICSQKMILQH